MNEDNMKKLVVLAAVVLGLGACNTVEGLGQDVSAGARAVDRAGARMCRRIYENLYSEAHVSL